jgi:tRNA-2-methylthio-N6-dimethylallyladenosine synthase
VRFTTSHPQDFGRDIIEAIDSVPALCDHVHLPVQSGSNRLLMAMNRAYTREQYLHKVEALRGRLPGISLSTDIIVGFHGESEGDFRATTELMYAVGYDSAFMFKYSLREHTRAFKLGDSVSEAEKGRRLAEVIAIQEEISLERNRAIVGVEFPVLVEGPARRGNGMLAGKTPQFKTAIFQSAPGVKPGETVTVRVESATAHSLICVLA